MGSVFDVTGWVTACPVTAALAASIAFENPVAHHIHGQPILRANQVSGELNGVLE